jgi:diguanylate cyclase
MTQREEFQRTIGYGEAAIGQLRRNEIAAYPRNYELWYTYCAGFNHALNKAVNEILRLRGRITAEEVYAVYGQFLAPSRLGDRIEEVGGKIASEIDDVVAAVEKTIAANAGYCDALSGASDELARTVDGSRVSGIVQSLISATRETESNNRHLEVQLAESRRHIAELQESLDAIRYESLTDELTTLANRKHFDQSIERAVLQVQDGGEPFSLLITDIDHFKKFNDTYGHLTGDQVLRLVAIALKQNVKGHDVAARYGGEEFIVLLPRTALMAAVTVADNIRRAVMGKELMRRSTGETLGRVTISLGVANWRKGDTVASLLERADACLYAAKHGGRNCVVAETALDDAETDLEARVA